MGRDNWQIAMGDFFCLYRFERLSLIWEEASEKKLDWKKWAVEAEWMVRRGAI